MGDLKGTVGVHPEEKGKGSPWQGARLWMDLEIRAKGRKKIRAVPG